MKEKYLIAHQSGTYEGNKIAKAIKVLAIIIFVAGIISGIFMGGQMGYLFLYSESEFSWTVALTWWAVGSISAILLLGLSEIIDLLEKMLTWQSIPYIVTQQQSSEH